MTAWEFPCWGCSRTPRGAVHVCNGTSWHTNAPDSWTHISLRFGRVVLLRRLSYAKIPTCVRGHAIYVPRWARVAFMNVSQRLLKYLVDADDEVREAALTAFELTDQPIVLAQVLLPNLNDNIQWNLAYNPRYR